MAKVVILDDYPNYADMVATYLTARGHDVRTDVIPFDIPELERFGPEVIVVSLVRKIEMLGAPIADFYKEVDGARALRQLQRSHSFPGIPLILSAIAVVENDVPDEIDYVSFVEFPQQIDILLRMVERLAKKPSSPAD